MKRMSLFIVALRKLSYNRGRNKAYMTGEILKDPSDDMQPWFYAH